MRAKPYHPLPCVVHEKTDRTCLARTGDHQRHHMWGIPAYGIVVRLVGKGDDWWPCGGEHELAVAAVRMAVETRILVVRIDVAGRSWPPKLHTLRSRTFVEGMLQDVHPLVEER